MQHFTYPVVLTPDESDGGFVVTCRDLPEAITQGDSIVEAIEQAEGALQAAIESRIEDGMELPIPSRPRKGEHSVHVPVSTAMKAALYIAMREQGVSESELARRLGLDEKEARRMLNPRYAAKVAALERALHALGKHVEVVVG
jgi:antitoxin HicB